MSITLQNFISTSIENLSDPSHCRVHFRYFWLRITRSTTRPQHRMDPEGLRGLEHISAALLGASWIVEVRAEPTADTMASHFRPPSCISSACALRCRSGHCLSAPVQVTTLSPFAQRRRSSSQSGSSQYLDAGPNRCPPRGRRAL